MRSLQLIFTAFLTFLFVINAVFWRKAIAVLLCGVLSFNSTSCYSFLYLDATANAAAPMGEMNVPFNSALNRSNLLKIAANNDDYQEPNLCPSEKLLAGRDQKRLRDLYSKALGVKEKLRERRENFLKTQFPEDIFPTFYYHTTVNALARINEGNLKYPDIALEEIIRFYSAYEYNRLQVQKEGHWKDYYDKAASVYRSGSPISSGDTLGIVYVFGGLLPLAVTAHIEFDLPRALSSLFNDNPNMSQDMKDSIEKDFFSFDDLFNKTSEEGFKDISTAINSANPGILGAGTDLTGYLGRDWVGSIEARKKRRQAWEDAKKGVLPTGNAKQPNEIKDLATISVQGCKETPCNQPNNQSNPENKQDSSNCKTTARSSNDPHLVTFDGLKYDLQTVGEVILIKSNHGAFEVQTRQTPYNNSGALSINSAVAIKVGSDRVALYAQGLPDADTTTPLRVNGKPTTIQGDKLALTGGGEILKQGGNYVISAPTGEKVLVSLNGSFLNLSPIVHNRSGKYNGLLGNVNGNPKDDLQVRDGKNVLEARSTYGDVKQVVNLVGLRLPGVLDRAEQVYFDRLYKEFANSWRVKQEESLFDYPAGKTTKSYLNPGFPDKYLTLNMLSADQIQKAQNACTEAKVTEDLMEGCIFDVGFSGFTEFARTTAEISGYIGIVNQLIPGLNIPTPDQIGNIIKPPIIKVPKICVFGACL